MSVINEQDTTGCSYINFIMSIPESEALKKSQTHSFALPSINRTRVKLPVNFKTSRSSHKTRQHNSVFLDKIKDLTKDVNYDELDTSNINEEQKQLKNLVREFNQETYFLLGRYLDKSMGSDQRDMTNSHTTEMRRSTRQHSASMMMEVHDKEIVNSNNALQICKKQLSVLEKRSENLKYVTTEEFTRKIQSTKEQIEHQKQVIKQILKNNTLRGQKIKKDDDTENHVVSILEYEKYMIEKKKERLVGDTNYVKEEEDKLKEKTMELEKKIKDISGQYDKLAKEDKEFENQKELRKKLQEKKKQFEQKKERKEFIQGKNKNKSNTKIQDNQSGSKEVDKNNATKSNSIFKSQPSVSSKFQFQYLKMLKQLDQVMNKTKLHEEETENYQIRVETSRKEIQLYEQKLSMLKKLNMEKMQRAKQAENNDKNKSSEKKGFIQSIFG